MIYARVISFSVLAVIATANLESWAGVGTRENDAAETVREMVEAMTSRTLVRDTVVQRAFLSQDLLRLMGANKAKRWRDFNADPIGTQDWSKWHLDKVVAHSNEVYAVFPAGKPRVQRDCVVVRTARLAR